MRPRKPANGELLDCRIPEQARQEAHGRIAGLSILLPMVGGELELECRRVIEEQRLIIGQCCANIEAAVSEAEVTRLSSARRVLEKLFDHAMAVCA